MLLQELRASDVEDAELQEAIALSLRESQPGAHLRLHQAEIKHSWECCSRALPLCCPHDC